MSLLLKHKIKQARIGLMILALGIAFGVGVLAKHDVAEQQGGECQCSCPC